MQKLGFSDRPSELTKNCKLAPAVGSVNLALPKEATGWAARHWVLCLQPSLALPWKTRAFSALCKREDIFSGRVIKREDIPGRVTKIRIVEQFPFLPLSRDGRYFSAISFVKTKQLISVMAKGENYSSSRTKYHLL